MQTASLLIAFTLLLTQATAAQKGAGRPSASSSENTVALPTRPASSSDSVDDVEQDLNLPPDMRARLAIERAENAYRKALKDVEQLDELSSEVMKRYRERGRLSPEDVKKMATIEKLAKRILEHAGGKEVEARSDQSPQSSLDQAIEQLSAAVNNIKKNLTESTRYEVSATVIASSNEVINLAQFIRRAQKQNN